MGGRYIYIFYISICVLWLGEKWVALYESLIDYIYGLLLIEKSGFFMGILCENVLSVAHFNKT